MDSFWNKQIFPELFLQWFFQLLCHCFWGLYSWFTRDDSDNTQLSCGGGNGLISGRQSPNAIGVVAQWYWGTPRDTIGAPPAHISRPPPRYYWGYSAIFPPVCLWVSFFLFIFAGSSLLKWKPSAEADGWDLYIGKAYLTLCTWRVGIWQFQTDCQEHCSKDAHGYVVSDIFLQPTIIGYTAISMSFIYISAWASALLVQLSGRCQSLRMWDE